MYAIVATGGKQCPVEPGKQYWVEKLDLEVGSEVVFEEVLACRAGDEFLVGQPTLSKVKVLGKVVKHGRQEKVEIIKFNRRKHSMKRAGHRQDQTCVLIESIAGVAPGAAANAEKPAAKKATAKKPAATKVAAEKKPAAKKTTAKKTTKKSTGETNKD